jgi:hypothetical protein
MMKKVGIIDYKGSEDEPECVFQIHENRIP